GAGPSHPFPTRRSSDLKAALLTLDVEQRAVLVRGTRRGFGIPVSHEAFRRYNTLNDPTGRPGPMAANPERALAPVGVFDSHDRRDRKSTRLNSSHVAIS